MTLFGYQITRVQDQNQKATQTRSPVAPKAEAPLPPKRIPDRLYSARIWL
jgi:hypothetical protein